MGIFMSKTMAWVSLLCVSVYEHISLKDNGCMVCVGCQRLWAYLVLRQWLGCLFWVSVFMGIFSSKTMAWVSVLGVNFNVHILF